MEFFYVKLNDTLWLHGGLDHGEFRNGHYVEVPPYATEDFSEAYKYDKWETKEIKSRYGKQFPNMKFIAVSSKN